MRSILTTLYFPRRPAWTARARILDRSSMSAPHLLRRLVAEATADDVVVLDGAVGRRDAYVDRMAAAAFARRRRGPHVVITDSTWTPGPAHRLALRVVDSPKTTYCVLSTDELANFPRTWGVDPARVVFTPFYWTLAERPRRADPGGSGVFAGGDSLRDYATLLTAVRHVDQHVEIATRIRLTRCVPRNVTTSDVRPSRFLDLMRSSAVVVVPLRLGLARSAGQQTYLNAMALGKLVVVSDVPGVRDHITHGETGLIVPAGDPDALARELLWATDPANARTCRSLRQRAHEVVVEAFNPDRYVQRILDVVDGLPP